MNNDEKEVDIVNDAFNDITNAFQSGAWLILKMLFQYIILPEIVGVIVFAGVLKIKGRLLSFIMVLITLVCFYLFVSYGLPSITDAALFD